MTFTLQQHFGAESNKNDRDEIAPEVTADDIEARQQKQDAGNQEGNSPEHRDSFHMRSYFEFRPQLNTVSIGKKMLKDPGCCQYHFIERQLVIFWVSGLPKFELPYSARSIMPVNVCLFRFLAASIQKSGTMSIPT